jgi:hypothetical protein
MVWIINEHSRQHVLLWAALTVGALQHDRKEQDSAE